VRGARPKARNESRQELLSFQGRFTRCLFRGLELASDAREVKGIGGLDSIGRARGGPAIRARVADELTELYSARAALRCQLLVLLRPSHMAANW
jgi:hypothetical protein